MTVNHTSKEEIGQIYVPFVNWALLFATVWLVLFFRSSSNMAAAYGIAVTTTMVITSVLFYVVVRHRWGWSTLKAGLVVAPLLVVDLAFFSANIPKIPDGGWFPVVVALGLLVQMATWRRGRQLVAERIRRGERTLGSLDPQLAEATTVPGTAVFLFKDPGMAPPALLNNLRHNKVLHRTTIVASVVTDEVPRADPDRRVQLERLSNGLYAATVHFGFMEEPDVPGALATLQGDGLVFDPASASYFVGRESVLATEVEGMPLPLERLYALLHRGADSAARFFGLPPDRIFEVGAHVEI
jgi:KUP system potassium uptake protein